MRRVPARHRNRPVVVKEKDRDAVKRFSSLLTAAAILAVGFLYAGHQHFAALHLGYETEKLRNALTDAKEEQRRLTVQKEMASSPARLEQAARQLGMQPMQAVQFDPLRRPPVEPRETKPSGDVKASVDTKALVGPKSSVGSKPSGNTKPVVSSSPKKQPQQPRAR
jgi:cell division protein FtsL